MQNDHTTQAGDTPEETEQHKVNFAQEPSPSCPRCNAYTMVIVDADVSSGWRRAECLFCEAWAEFYLGALEAGFEAGLFNDKAGDWSPPPEGMDSYSFHLGIYEGKYIRHQILKGEDAAETVRSVRLTPRQRQIMQALIGGVLKLFPGHGTSK